MPIVIRTRFLYAFIRLRSDQNVRDVVALFVLVGPHGDGALQPENRIADPNGRPEQIARVRGVMQIPPFP